MNKLKKSEIFLIVFLITGLYPIEFDKVLYIGLTIYRIKKVDATDEKVRK